jgi:hypothetical protein
MPLPVKWNPSKPHVRLHDFHDRSLSRGQKLSRRAAEERGCNSFGFFAAVLASQWFLFEIEPDFHLLTQLLQLLRRLSWCFLPVSKLINGSIRELALLRPVALTARPGLLGVVACGGSGLRAISIGS